MTYKELEKVNSEMVTIDIKGKPYPEVVEKIKAFKKIYPDGSITTTMLSDVDGKAVFKAVVAVETESGTVILGTGHAFEIQSKGYINQTSYIENAETSAVGRALSMAGFGSDKSVASLEEVAHAMTQQKGAEKISKKDADIVAKTLTDNQKEWAFKTYKVNALTDLTVDQYGDLMRRLNERKG